MVNTIKVKAALVVVSLATAIVLTTAASAGVGTWTQKANMPTARQWLSTSVVNGKIYAIGGITFHGGTQLATVEMYDPVTDTWSQKADMLIPRSALATSEVNGKIYAIGGGGGDNDKVVEEYDPATDTWTQKADIPTPRRHLATSVVNGRIYAIGGGDTPISLKKVEVYDPATDTWTEKASKPIGSKFISSSVVNGKIYVFGGQAPNGWMAFPFVEEYDPATDTWTMKADMPAPRTAFSTSVVDDKIYAFGGGGRKGGAPLSTLFQYEPATDTWTAEDDMPVRLTGMDTSVVGGRIYVIGGSSVPHPYDPPLSTVWEYDTGLDVPSPDFNGDGIVDGADMSIMVGHWHTDNALYDIAPLPFGDDFVDVQDLVFLSEHLFQEVDDPTLVAHWALDESQGDIAQDSAGDNLGIVMGGPAWRPDAGQVDGAIELDGLDDAIIAGPLPSLADPEISSGFSVLVWVKGGAAGQAIISEPAGSDWLSLDPLTGHLMTELTNAGRGTTPLQSQAVIADGDWHRIGFVWDGLYRTLHVDGVAVAEDTQDGLQSPGSSFYIGTGKAMAPGTYFSGMIDDVRIYSRAITP